jgi:O-acetyl-ADP-ribose deacetylase (regulator of RNase III)
VKIILTSREDGLTAAWTKHCADLPDVFVHSGSILDVVGDAVVSPANSFGFMDGGIDALYTKHFGRKVQDRVRGEILKHHHGELLIGAAVIVPTDDEKIPFLIAAPTMRVPMILPKDTINPYLATRAVLLLIRYGQFTAGQYAGTPIRDHIRAVAFPGMGTGVGKVPAETAAHQVRRAIEQHHSERCVLPTSWAEASEEHQLLYTSKPKRLQ